jgi:hypothetical protein
MADAFLQCGVDELPRRGFDRMVTDMELADIDG